MWTAPLADEPVALGRYGQAPDVIEAPGPAFLKVAEPTLESMQYVVAVAVFTRMFLIPASYEAWRTAEVAPA